MAKQKGTHTVIREDGDACPRELCGGKLHQRGDGLMECSQCAYTFNKQFNLGPGGEGSGTPPVIVPDVLVTALAKASHAHMMEIADKLGEKETGKPVAEPTDAEATWAGMTPKLRDDHRAEAKNVLERMWPAVQAHFRVSGGDAPSSAPVSLESRAAADLRALITEIAIPSLHYCEEKYGHDDQARLNLEAGIGVRG